MGTISIEDKELYGEVEFILDADTVASDQPGDDSCFVTDMGVAPLIIRVKGECTENTDSLSDVRKAIMTTGELALILDSGWKYKVFRRSFRPLRIAGEKQTGLNGYINKFTVVFVCQEPYQFTVSENNRSKSITSNNQQWSADDSGYSLSTDGEVDAEPNIQVTSSVAAYTIISQTSKCT